MHFFLLTYLGGTSYLFWTFLSGGVGDARAYAPGFRKTVIIRLVHEKNCVKFNFSSNVLDAPVII